jgi:hypothetical protein
MSATESRELDVLFVSPVAFRRDPQVGLPCKMEWPTLALYLSRAVTGASKEIAGAWSPALYRDNVRRKAHLITIGALVVDVDKAGDVDAVADLLARYRTIVHETFQSTRELPRCRAVIELAEPIDAATYEATHAVVRGFLVTRGVTADEGAKDASRLSYAPVRPPGAEFRLRTTDGAPLDAKRVLAAQPPPPPRLTPTAPEHRDRYKAAALRRAAEKVERASEGARHYVLCREAYSLARLGLTEAEVEAALMPSFIAAAGKRRESEGRRTIRDCVRARGAA